jgi:putative transposase
LLKAFKYRIKPNKEQAELFAKTFGATRYIFNYALAKSKEAYEKTKKKPSKFDLIKEIPILKRKEETSWLKDSPSHALQQSILNLDKAYINFFKKNTKFPRFKSKKDNHQSFCEPDKNRIKIEGSDKYSFRIKLPKSGWIKIYKDRRIPESGEIRQATVSRESTGKYFVSVLVLMPDIPAKLNKKDQLNKTDKSNPKSVGIDLGIKHFAVLSDGKDSIKIENPKNLKKSEKKLARLNRALSRKKKGSNRRKKSKTELALCHEKVRNQRKDFLHKLSTSITKKYDKICIEDLNVKGMVQNHCLAKSISDCSWGEFRRQLEYKSLWNNKKLNVIGRFEASSKTCGCCGEINKDLKLKDRFWKCSVCNTSHDRDVNAANNILRLGLSLQELKCKNQK